MADSPNRSRFLFMSTSPLRPEQLYRHCPTEWLASANTDPSGGFYGQERAVDAIRLGIEMTHPGYNVYVASSAGAGRVELTREVVAGFAGRRKSAGDWCYVYNFNSSHEPIAIWLPSGMGRTFSKDIEKLILSLLTTLPAAFKSEEYRNRLIPIKQSYERSEPEEVRSLATQARAEDVIMLRTPQGYHLAPCQNGKALEQTEFDKLPAEKRKHISQALDKYNVLLTRTLESLPPWEEEMQDAIENINIEVVTRIVNPMVEHLRNGYPEHPEIQRYLEALRDDVIANFPDFLDNNDDGAPHNPKSRAKAPEFRRYCVNPLIAANDTDSAPIVYEMNPTFQNVMGRLENLAYMGTLTTDLTLIKPGALHRANGGYLLLDADKILQRPYVWEGLKRSLTSKEIKIEPVEEWMSQNATLSLSPQPIPLDIKLILLGDRETYHLLSEYDSDFTELFKIYADFNEECEYNADSVARYADWLKQSVKAEQLLPFSADALAKVIEHASRLAEDSERLILRNHTILDVMRESSHWASRETSVPEVTRAHVCRALAERRRRSSQIEQQLQQEILRKTLLIDTDGMVTAQVNALTVLENGDICFGLPSRITATARMGDGKIIDIERETDLSGALHSKGVMILTAYLTSTFQPHKAFSVTATLAFEQSYAEVDGDSASGAELCALLSAIGRLPLRQDLALTGAVNQFGQLQAVGGVNEKIEGFFAICDRRGLTGKQGVIIPQANIKNLMLEEPVVAAVAEGRFHLYAVDTIEAAAALLTGIPWDTQDPHSDCILKRMSSRLDSYERHAAEDSTRPHWPRSPKDKP